MQLHDLIRVLGRAWALIAVIVLLGIGGGAASTLALPNTYRTEAQLYVAATSADNPSDLFQGATYVQIAVKNYAELAVSPYVLNPVIEQLGLREDADRLATRLSVTVPDATTIVSIQGEASTPGAAIVLTNAVATSLQKVATSLTPGQTNAVPPVRVTLVRAANTSVSRTAATTWLAAAAGGASGLVIAVGAVLLMDAARTRITSVGDAESIAGSGALAVVGSDPPRGSGARTEAAILRDRAFLASRLLFLRDDLAARTIALTAPRHGGGTTTTVLAAANELAAAGVHVLIIDATGDGVLTARLGLADREGWAEAVRGTVDPRVVLVTQGAGRPAVMPGGAATSAGLLDERAIAAVLTTAGRDFDLVLIDAPPVLEDASAGAIVRKTAVTVVVSRARRTRTQCLAEIFVRLGDLHAPIGGFVVVGADGADRRSRRGSAAEEPAARV